MAKPIYQSLKENIISEIKDLAANTPISSERELAAEYKVSRMTVRRAIQELVTEGYLYTNKNKGTFVADEKLRKTNINEDILDTGDQYKVIHFNTREPNKSVKEALEMSGIDSCIRLVRVNYKGDSPVSLDEIYINSKYVNNNNLEPVSFLEQYTESIGDKVTQQDFIPELVPVQYAKYLGVDINTPIIKIETTYLSVKGRPYIYSITYNNPREVLIRITT